MRGTIPLPFVFYPTFLCFIFLSSSYNASAADSDTLNSTQSLTTNQTLVSSGEKYELGFFSYGNPTKYYLGIWYKNIPQTIVWVANRDAPVLSSSAVFRLNGKGNIVILDSGSTVLWSSKQNESSSDQASDNPVLIQLLDSGNLIVRKVDDESSEGYLWQSFDHPTDTLLPGQKLGVNYRTGENLYLTAWRSPTDPASGRHLFKMDPNGDPEIYLLDGDNRTYRSGPWVGQRFSGVPEMKPSDSLNFSFVSNEEGSFYSFYLVDDEIKSRLMVDSSGVLRRFTWVPDTEQWSQFWYAPKDQCDHYRVCGPYGICDASALFVCKCVNGFTAKNEQSWELRDGVDGCVRKTRLDCENDGFLTLKEMKLPETLAVFVDANMSLEDCRDMCKKNCSCTAYANSRVVYGSGSGCITWSGELEDMRLYAEGGQDLFVRLAASDIVTEGLDNGVSTTGKVLMGVGITLGVGLLLVAGYCIWKKRKSQIESVGRLDQRTVSRPGTNERSQDFLLSSGIPSKRDYSGEANPDDIDLPLIDFDTLALATCNFSDVNKLGQGGFGIVYKGVLLEGEEIAVKRLSKESGQGVEEFKNELRLIAKLQHRNLVRLLACCVEREEKMLVYEYLPNRSLDCVVFNKDRCSSLDWQKRFNIICGIARGLLYLHQDSRFRIIHRDLKASNILLDGDMNPKISDFGMARIFGGDETESNNTRRVVGTYGYMSPEYAMDGVFSVKSDVFSYGVLTLEIVTGKKNRGFYNSDGELNLLGYAWKLWREGNGMELVDQTIRESCSIDEVLRCIQVGLLCVQERVEDRPTMSSVLLMLSSASASLPQPKIPGFCMARSRPETDSSSSKQDETSTVNSVTVTMIEGR